MIEVVKVDAKGRILIPKDMREKAELREGSYVRVEARKEGILIEPLQPVADRYFGAFKIAKWPKDLDESAVEVIKKWWTPKQAAP